MNEYDFYWVRGDDNGEQLAFSQAANGQDCACPDQLEPMDFDGCQFAMWIVPRKGERIELSSENGAIEVADNLVKILCAHAQTEGVQWTQASYDLQCTTADGVVRTLVRGQIYLQRDITGATDG